MVFFITTSNIFITSFKFIKLFRTSGKCSGWQYVQFRKIGDIVYLRGLAARVLGSVTSGDLVFTLPAGFCPPANLAFTAEPHATLTAKHRVDISSTCNVNVATTAGATP